MLNLNDVTLGVGEQPLGGDQPLLRGDEALHRPWQVLLGLFMALLGQVKRLLRVGPRGLGPHRLDFEGADGLAGFRESRLVLVET